MRKLLANRLVWLLVGTIALGFLLMLLAKPMHMDVDDFRTFFGVIFTAVVTLVSTVIGFYFGSQSAIDEANKAVDDEV